jgi:sporulation protein YlmC with PRC-barrel domain
MLKRTLAAGLLACVAFVPLAQAQGYPSANQPQAGQSSEKFVRGPLQSSQFRGSDLVGQYVYNPKDENIGKIGDLILDQNGQVSAVVIDVGGFLGIGANEVAVRYDALRFEPGKERVAAAETGAPNATGRSSTYGPASQSSDQASGSGMADIAGRAGAGTAAGSAGGADGTAGTKQSAANENETGSDSTLHARIVLDATRDELKNAPKLADAAPRGAQEKPPAQNK